MSRITTTRDGSRVTGVEYYDEQGRKKRQYADCVVLCAFTCENVRVLLTSVGTGHPEGLANRSGSVGSYLMSHPSVSVFGLFKEEVANYVGATGGQLLCQDDYQKTGHENGAFGSRQWAIAQALKPNDFLGIAMARPDIFGADLDVFLKKAAHHLGCMTAICEDQPLAENRVVLAKRRDQDGVPLAEVRYTVSEDGYKLWQLAAQEGLEIMKAAGATETWHGPRGAQHLMGGTIMGASPETSVTNAESQCHDVPNLFVGGPGLFPTSAAVNSTYTVHALAMRSARYIRDNWAQLG